MGTNIPKKPILGAAGGGGAGLIIHQTVINPPNIECRAIGKILQYFRAQHFDATFLPLFSRGKEKSNIK